VIGAYQNTLRGEPRSSNYFSGRIDEVTIYKYTMSDSEVKEDYLDTLLRYTGISGNKTTVELSDSIETEDKFGIPKYTQKSNASAQNFTEQSTILDNIQVKLSRPIISQEDNLGFGDRIKLLVNGIVVLEPPPVSRTITLYENIGLRETKVPATPFDSFTTTESITISDKVALKINGIPISTYKENLGLSDKLSLFVNNQTIGIQVSPELNPLKSSYQITELPEFEFQYYNDTEALIKEKNDLDDARDYVVRQTEPELFQTETELILSSSTQMPAMKSSHLLVHYLTF